MTPLDEFLALPWRERLVVLAGGVAAAFVGWAVVVLLSLEGLG